MAKNLSFRISAALKDVIGKDLITDDFVAIFELVKNAYDAHAKNVNITFIDADSPDGTIIIEDDGKGMSYEDLISKWLFVAYSAKKDGTEDEDFDYRDSIYSKRPFAGAKGIGRFSCDRLGETLVIETKKKAKRSQLERLSVNWSDFESDSKNEFKDILVKHETINDDGFSHGTKLIISGLRNVWYREKYQKLKSSLAKLIDPLETDENVKSDFHVFIHVPQEMRNDLETEDTNQIVNGAVKNFIFETLGLKTTRITSKLTNDGKSIVTEIKDGGTSIYKIQEKNEFPLLTDISITLYYLNQSAKNTFTRRMGLPTRQYGHVFVYRNGFRIYPYGEPGEDPLKIDSRKAQGYNRFLGTRDIIGKISINETNDNLKETSSRSDGLIKTETYFQMEEFFWSTLRRLEKYVVDIQLWGLMIEDDSSDDFNARVTDLISKLTSSQSIESIHVPADLFDLLTFGQENSVESLIENLKRIAAQNQDFSLLNESERLEQKLEKLQRAHIEAEEFAEAERKRALKATEELREKVSENLFLKSINTQEYEEMIALIHHIGIYAGTIDTNLKGISLRVQNKVTITSEELNDIIKALSFETKKILSVVGFATKANFKLKSEEMEDDLAKYIEEYLLNITPSVSDRKPTLSLKHDNNLSFKRVFKPIEINIIIDNIVNNAKKAKAETLKIILGLTNSRELQVDFVDDGIGISPDNISRIFDFGYTTTDGSGIGLYHVRQIMESLKGNVSVKNNDEKGITLTLKFK